METIERRILAACLTLAAPALPAAPPSAAAHEKASVRAAVDTAGMDPAVAPGDDFFAYANGGWFRKAVIPDDRGTCGPAMDLVELTGRRVADIVKETLKAEPGTEARKIGDFYASFLDEAAIEAKGTEPLKPILAPYRILADRLSLSGLLGAMVRADVDVLNATHLHTPNLLGLWVAQDLDDPRSYAPFLLQGGLSMPGRDYYLDGSEGMRQVREAFRAHVAAMLKLAGEADADADAHAAAVLELETRMAKVHASQVDTEDVEKGDNHWKREDFEAKAPGILWKPFLKAAGLDRQPGFVVWQPEALKGLSALVASEPLESWKAWLVFHAVEARAFELPRAFAQEYFAFHGRVLRGTPKMPERWKLGVEAVNEALGEAVGKLYVKRYFSEGEKRRVQAMVRNLTAAFAKRIDALTWMSPATKAKAKAKLKALKVGVGYPDHWRDYSGLEVAAGDAFGNAERAERFQYRASLHKLGQPVDRGEWVMTPQTVNAVNLPAMNALNFPAAILQPPFFDPAHTAAQDYGATGATIGHEVSHSFDDQGALFDAEGRLKNWWTPEDFAHFKASGSRLAQQFDAYRPFPDLAVNGRQTLSENIADVAGLAAAYDAYRLSLDGKPAPKVQGFTGDQQFFLSFAQSWRGKHREPELRQRVLTDGHAPGEYRADTVRNLDAWYQAFGAKPGQKLYLEPKDRVRVW